MKILLILSAVTSLVFLSGSLYAQGLILGYPLEFWNDADIILDGVVISTKSNVTDHLVQHELDVEQYFKNPKSEKITVVYGPDAYNENWFYPKTFEKGQRALFYLKKTDDKYIILEQSIAATQKCTARDMLGLSTIPQGPVDKGRLTMYFDPYQTCNGYFYSVDYLSKTLKPVQQLGAGIKPRDVRCEENFVLVAKTTGSPACVKPETAQKLVERGWVKPLS